jgi:hypothetical protein
MGRRGAEERQGASGQACRGVSSGREAHHQREECCQGCGGRKCSDAPTAVWIQEMQGPGFDRVRRKPPSSPLLQAPRAKSRRQEESLGSQWIVSVLSETLGECGLLRRGRAPKTKLLRARMQGRACRKHAASMHDLLRGANTRVSLVMEEEDEDESDIYVNMARTGEEDDDWQERPE